MKNILVSIKLLVLFFIIQNYSFAQTYDTVFKANLFETQKNTVKASFQYDETGSSFNGKFKLTIDNISINDSCEYSYDYFEVKVVDIYKNDDYREIAILYYFGESPEYMIYRYTGKKIISLGMISSMDEPEFKGNGVVKASSWMGFWRLKYEYIFNDKKMKFDEKIKDEVDVVFYEGFENKFTVKEKFSIYKERDKNSEVVTTFRNGDVISILKAYIKVKCEDNYKDPCIWYLIKDSKGNKGWLQLKDFQEKVDGIPWAG